MDNERTIFWNVEMLVDFMRKEGGLYVPDAELIEPALEAVTQTAKLYKIKVINTMDSHDYDSEEISTRPDFKTTFPRHGIPGSRGAEFIPATKPKAPYVVDWRCSSLYERLVLLHRNIVLTKDHVNVFDNAHGSPHVYAVLELLKPSRAFVYGVATNVCVDHTVRGLLERNNLEVLVISDAIKGLPGMPDPTESWKQSGVKLVESAHLEQYLR